MDGDRFDQFARSLARNVSRRSMVKGLSALLAGSSIAARPLSSQGAPSPCNAYCAGEPGARGAQCRQACKACGGPDSPGFCYDELVRGYTCCPGGLECFDAWRYPGGETIICCPGAEQVCSRTGGSFCCDADTHCAYEDLCCPIGVEACFDPGSDSYICGSSCRDLCLGFDVCGEADGFGNCLASTCSNPCNGGELQCGPPDGNGECVVERCTNVCNGELMCGTPNERDHCQWGFICYDPCKNEDRCEYSDGNGICYGVTACYDPDEGAFACGASCYDPSLGMSVCGTPVDDDGLCSQ